MKKLILLILGIAFNFCALNAKKPIMYVVSDSIEICIGNYLKEIPSQNRIGFYIYTENNQILLSLISIPSNSHSIIKEYIDRSNRVILINKNTYPLLFDYDFDFGTKTPIENIGDYGNRDGSYLRARLLSESQIFELKIKSP